jgi:hypothetical protein
MDTTNVDTKNKVKNFFTSKSYKLILWVIAELILLVIVFALGMRVGLHKAKYSYAWGANYERNFMNRPNEPMKQGMPSRNQGGPMGFFQERGGDFRNAHGLTGNIVSITGNNIVVKGSDNKENTASVNDKTMIKSGKDDIKIGDLKTDEKIVILGKPDNNGVIDAELIRVFADSTNSNTSANNPPASAPANTSSNTSTNTSN